MMRNEFRTTDAFANASSAATLLGNTLSGDLAEPSSPDTVGGIDLLEKQLPQIVEPGDHERYSHYVRKDKIVESAVMGNAVVALCGKVWVPSRDPEKFPVCPTCKEILDAIKAGEGSGNGPGNGSGSGGGNSGDSGGSGDAGDSGGSGEGV